MEENRALPARGDSGKAQVAAVLRALPKICRSLAKIGPFCQTLAKSPAARFSHFADLWQNMGTFADHWQNALGRGMRPWVERNGARDYGKTGRFHPKIPTIL